MCQLSLLDFRPDTKVSVTFIRALTELNVLGINGKANKDGFGFITFSKPERIIKSEQNAIAWWIENSGMFGTKIKNANGLYHVRDSSFANQISNENAHPFRSGNIILFHNGTVSELRSQREYVSKHVTDKMIDSERFVTMLNQETNGEKLTTEHIKNTYKKYYAGPFAFLIYDLAQKNKVFVVRGKDRTLTKSEFYLDGEPIGITLNTGKWELFYWSRIVKSSLESYWRKPVDAYVSELPENSIFEYCLGKYQLGEKVNNIEQQTDTTVSEKKASVGSNVSASTYSNNTDDKTLVHVRRLQEELVLSTFEIELISELLMKKSFQTFNLNDFDKLHLFLLELKESGYKGAKDIWKDIPSSIRLKMYESGNISFPYMFNGKKRLKKAEKLAQKDS